MANPSFNILVVGGGLGGLSAAIALGQKGHKVTIVESTSKLQTIGGGISVPPNSVRVMEYFGLAKRLADAAEVEIQVQTYFKRYNGELLCDGGMRAQLYQYSHLNIHRAPYQILLAEAAKEVGAVIHLDTRIVDVDDSGLSPVAIAKDGRRFEADVIIGADGAKSTLRSLVYPDVQLSSSYNCYRAVIEGSIIRKDPDLAPLLDESNLWWGPDRVVVGVPVQRGAFYSLEATHPGNTGTAGDWSKKGDVELLRKTYLDFETPVVKLMKHVRAEDLLVWKLTQLPELASWVFKSGTVVLMADAAHSITPFSGQGHAMAVEDSACLAECLARAKNASDIPKALRAFETIRKPRTKLLGAFAERNAHIWQLPDGEEQLRRDDMIRKNPIFSTSNWDGKHVDEVPGLPPDPLFFPWMLAHDVVHFTNRRLDEIWDRPPNHSRNSC